MSFPIRNTSDYTVRYGINLGNASKVYRLLSLVANRDVRVPMAWGLNKVWGAMFLAVVLRYW